MSETLPPPLSPSAETSATAAPNPTAVPPNGAASPKRPAVPPPLAPKRASKGVLIAIAAGCATGVMAVAAVAWFALRGGEPPVGERKTVTAGGVEFALRWCPPGGDVQPPCKPPEEGFWMGETEVTQAQWVALMGENPSRCEGSDHPVESVSWDECQTFLKRLNALPAVRESGLEFRLPTEEEWEYACRAGATGDYCKLADGTEITEGTLGQVAWIKDNSDLKTHPVGWKTPNAFGLRDTYGNVWEWTSTTDGGGRVLRGGGWGDLARLRGTSFRSLAWSDAWSGGIGFRLCASGRANGRPSGKPEAGESAIETLCSSMVLISPNLKMGKYEVTQAQWEAVMGSNPSHFKGADRPVECVSWDDCQVFLEKLNATPAAKASGLTFRLPLSWEWSHACCAGATNRYCRLANGTEITEETIGEVAWSKADSDGETHPVGRKKPNALKLYDMFGNVREWTSYGGESPEKRLRGGGWSDSVGDPDFMFSEMVPPGLLNSDLGLRLCADVSR